MRKLQLPGRSKDMPRLSDTDYKLVRKKGIKEIKKDAKEIVRNKLKDVPGEEKEKIPSAGNPIYKAIHACRVSSRKELFNAHRTPADRDLKEEEIDAITDLLTRWVAREYNFYTMQEPSRQRKLQDF